MTSWKIMIVDEFDLEFVTDVDGGEITRMTRAVFYSPGEKWEYGFPGYLFRTPKMGIWLPRLTI
jgi:hypothetical protein